METDLKPKSRIKEQAAELEKERARADFGKLFFI